MTDLEALTESIQEELYKKEPLAAAILFYLNKIDPGSRTKILDTFDNIVKHQLQLLIDEATNNDLAAKPEIFN